MLLLNSQLSLFSYFNDTMNDLYYQIHRQIETLFQIPLWS